jgi:hypothetical protein
MTVGLDVFVQLVMAAIATEPLAISTERPAASTRTVGYDSWPSEAVEPVESTGVGAPTAIGASAFFSSPLG